MKGHGRGGVRAQEEEEEKKLKHGRKSEKSESASGTGLWTLHSVPKH